MAEYQKYSGTVEGHPMMEEKRDPMSGAMENQKTSFRDTNILVDDYDSVMDHMIKPTFAYGGTDNGVAGQTN